MNIRKLIDRPVYLDNAATTFPKPLPVYAGVLPSILQNGGNPGRSGHSLSKGSADAVFSTRERIADLVGFDAPERVIFTQNATYALHLAIRGFLKDKKQILISDIEHNAVFREVYALKQYGYEYTTVKSGEGLRENLEKALTKETGLAVINAASNVCGIENDLSVLSEFRQKSGIPVIADVSQLIGHKEINLEKTPLDAICAPGHKGLFGLMGCGFAVYGNDREPRPSIFGGSGSESFSPNMPKYLPESLEAGTLPVPAICSLNSGIKYVSDVGVSNIEKRLDELTDRISRTVSELRNFTVAGPCGHGIVSILHSSLSSERLSERLESYGILTRAGLHCAPLAHERLGTEKTGTVRLSFSAMNTDRDLERTCYALKLLDNI